MIKNENAHKDESEKWLIVEVLCFCKSDADAVVVRQVFLSESENRKKDTWVATQISHIKYLQAQPNRSYKNAFAT